MNVPASVCASPARRASRLLALTLGFALSLALGVLDSASAKLETWRQETSAAFSKGKREGVVISDNGVARLAQAIEPTSKLDATRVWDLARTDQGAIFAATGDSGQVFRREGGRMMRPGPSPSTPTTRRPSPWPPCPMGACSRGPARAARWSR